MPTLIPIPRYACHKQVCALKIRDIFTVHRGILIVPVEDGFPPFEMPPEWAAKHKPEIGGYWVQYDDGYQSYSPAAAFESGYSRLPDSNTDELPDN